MDPPGCDAEFITEWPISNAAEEPCLNPHPLQDSLHRQSKRPAENKPSGADATKSLKLECDEVKNKREFDSSSRLSGRIILLTPQEENCRDSLLDGESRCAESEAMRCSRDRQSAIADRSCILGNRFIETPSNTRSTGTTVGLIKFPVSSGSKKGSDKSEDEGEMPAGMALSRWWKRTGRHLVDKSRLPCTRNPKSFLHHLARLPEGESFLKSRRVELRRLLDAGDTRATLYGAMASVEDFLRQPQAAARLFQLACQASPDNAMYKLMLEKVTRQAKALEQQQNMAASLRDVSTALSFPASRQVAQRLADELSFAEFCEFARQGEPVVIKGLAKKVTTVPWTLDHIRQVAGSCSATVKRLVPDSTEWARLENSRSITVAQFIDGLVTRGKDSATDPSDDSTPSTGSQAVTCAKGKELSKQGSDEVRERHTERQTAGRDAATSASVSKLDYLFDWSIPQYCPQLAEELIIPKYFAGDYLQRTSPGSLYRDTWPSLFVAPPGALSELHVDTFASNFWMALFQGQKRWLFFSKSDLPLLYPEYLDSLDPIFQVDLATPDLQTFPLLSLTSPMECILEAGDVLFVPSGCPHRVETLETSVAISANYVDATNLDSVKGELRAMEMVEPQAANLLRQLESSSLLESMPDSASDLSWLAFKNSQLEKTGACKKMEML